LVKFLIEVGANINAQDADNVTCLHLAVDNGDMEILNLLLKSNKCDLNFIDKNVKKIFLKIL
jgi:ankyrin repeat protein